MAEGKSVGAKGSDGLGRGLSRGMGKGVGVIDFGCGGIGVEFFGEWIFR